MSVWSSFHPELLIIGMLKRCVTAIFFNLPLSLFRRKWLFRGLGPWRGGAPLRAAAPQPPPLVSQHPLLLLRRNSSPGRLGAYPRNRFFHLQWSRKGSSVTPSPIVRFWERRLLETHWNSFWRGNGGAVLQQFCSSCRKQFVQTAKAEFKVLTQM